MGAIAFNGEVYPAGSTAAKNSVFDNTGTDLDSTNAEDAIKEVDGKVGDTDISSIGDGTATGAIAELSSKIVLDKGIAPMQYSPSGYYYCNIDISQRLDAGYAVSSVIMWSGMVAYPIFINYINDNTKIIELQTMAGQSSGVTINAVYRIEYIKMS